LCATPLASVKQCLVWNTYGPIAISMQYSYGWSDSTIAMMANWGTIMFVLSVLPLSFMLEKRSDCKRNEFSLHLYIIVCL
jgi:hypothetical protein